MISFKLKTPYIELFKLLKVVNLCDSGGMAKQLIADGQVLVDGEVETRKACKIKAGQKVVFNNETVSVEQA